MNKQLDASTAELVQLLTRYGYSVQHIYRDYKRTTRTTPTEH